MLYVIGIPNCNTIKKTKTWLESKEVEFEFINVKKEPLTKDELAELEFKVGIDVLVNKRGTTYKKLELKDKELSADEMLDVLVENQSMIKRPVIIYEEAVLVGFDEDSMENFLKENELITTDED